MTHASSAWRLLLCCYAILKWPSVSILLVLCLAEIDLVVISCGAEEETQNLFYTSIHHHCYTEIHEPNDPTMNYRERNTYEPYSLSLSLSLSSLSLPPFPLLSSPALCTRLPCSMYMLDCGVSGLCPPYFLTQALQHIR
ncbi:hypothetical protein LOC432723 [Mus musculus]|nr:hypothetical protein LOC432723 [Mus musculus]